MAYGPGPENCLMSLDYHLHSMAEQATEVEGQECQETNILAEHAP
jgi:hypothetical protein